MQKINDLSEVESPEKAEDYCSTKSEWVLKENESKWVDCFKKYSSEKAPFMSDKLLKMIQSKGNIRCSLKYLEYLTLKCSVDESRLHTELGCIYVQYIERLLRKYKKEPVQGAAQPKEEEEHKNEEGPGPKDCPYDLEAARQD
jgi:hypothetical protein